MTIGPTEIIIISVILCPILCGIAAAKKGRSIAGWAVLGVFFGVIALALLLLLPARQNA